MKCFVVENRTDYHCVHVHAFACMCVCAVRHAGMRLCIHAREFTQLSDTGQQHRHVVFVLPYLPLAMKDAVI